ncbi:hypothetical protein CTA2_3007 [Colletotrichum tanaceti]|uniref:Uncharacterized protein n=1 Tax=Colletotrichum tanaceti TaxID=1306861 RepID=A0A4U6XLU2_9PEZI|nr:hypothetical protein CTA2_3007 [Colletotrichum tanaceti]TKW56640.1 hypothetical protein CTA1_3263 [Colletotrichum tanaceti]
MGRPHRREADIEQDPYESYGRSYAPAAGPYSQHPPRGRSPGSRRRNMSEPAAATATAYDDFQRDPEPREQPREHTESRKHRKDPALGAHAAHSEPRQARRSHKNRYYDDDNDVVSSRARSHGRPAHETPSVRHHRIADDRRNDFDSYAPASRHGRERQHAYHPPKTSETRRSKYADFETDNRRPRYADYDGADIRTAEPLRSRYQQYGADLRGSDRRQARHADYEDVPRGGGESYRGRYADHEANARPQPRDYTSSGRGRFRNESPDRYAQPSSQQRPVRGRSMPRKGVEGVGVGPAGSARPRAKSAVGYAALGEAAQTAFRVGSQAALQMRSEPGPWIGEKGTRVATAALGAALVDTFVGHKATGMRGGMRHQALRQACEMGIRNFVIQPTVNTATRRSGGGSGGGDGYSSGGHGSSGRRRH